MFSSYSPFYYFWDSSPYNDAAHLKMGFPAQLTESTNHKHAQRYVSWVILAPAKVTTNVNHHRQSLVLHNYSPDYLCSHGEGVCGNIYLCWFIPNITSVPRDLVPSTRCYLTTTLHSKKIEAGQFSVPRAENPGIILSLDSIPRAFRGLKHTSQLRKREYGLGCDLDRMTVRVCISVVHSHKHV